MKFKFLLNLFNLQFLHSLEFELKRFFPSFEYILLIILLFVIKPDIINNQSESSKSIRCVLPLAFVIIAIVCYYFYATIEWFRS